MLAWTAMLWFDTTIFTLTLVKALRMRRHFPGGLLEVVFRDGERARMPCHIALLADEFTRIRRYLVLRVSPPFWMISSSVLTQSQVSC